jgi:CRISPR-associated protein Csd1
LSADTAVCYWAATPAGDDFASQLIGLLEGDPNQVRELYQSIWKGIPVEIDDPSAFYAITLSGAQGRAIVRDWFESTVRLVAIHLAQHFTDLAIVRNTPQARGREHPPALPLHILLRSLAVRGDDRLIPAALTGQMVHAALSGATYPFSIIQRALERTRAEIGRNDWSDRERRDARAALIKAVLNRRRRFHPATTSYPEIKKFMDPNNSETGYLLGRLMAFLERAQQLALGEDVNATVIDRFFSAASATPRAVFIRLLRGFHHHVRKAEDKPMVADFAQSIKHRVDEIVYQIQEQHGNFPPYLSLEEQGLFILGFHHQRHLLHREAWARQKGGKPAVAEPAEA